MFKKIGQFVIDKVSDLPYIFGYTGRVLSSSFFFFVREKHSYKVLLMQLLFTFIEALPLVAILALAIGSGLYLVGNSLLVSIGQPELIYMILVMIISKELGPLLVGFVVTARSATAIATEIGGMVTSNQIESYVSFGIDPIAHLAAPRFIGVTLSVFLLNLYFSFCGLIGPFLVGKIVDPVGSANYFNLLLNELSISTILISTAKSFIFGMFIALVSTYAGFKVNRASTEIPVAGIQAVGNSILLVILADVLFIILPFILG
ncbi:MAG: ABC transporter permease [Treponema sp.]|nr:ABC transporter permease [Treponema sp.]